MTDIRTGRCLCGDVSYQINGLDGMFIRCHCTDCQRISGAGHLPQLMVPRDVVTFRGQIATHRWPSDKGNEIEVGFCATCSSALYKSTTMMPDRLAVTVGTLEDVSDLGEPHDVYTERRAPWD